MLELTLVLPVQNQADIITPVYRQIHTMMNKLRVSYECILVENGSTDNTLLALKALAHKYSHTRFLVAPKGYGSAVLAGLAKARGKYVGYMASDGQVDLVAFPKLWRLAKSGRYDLVKVCRITRESLVRTIVSWGLSTVSRLLFHTGKLDINGSPRIFLREHLATLDLGYTDSFIDTEFAAKAALLGWRIKEISMKTLPRYGGKSTRSFMTFVEFFYNLFRYKTGPELKQWRLSRGL